MKLRNLLLAATIMALPAVAQAQPVTGFYVGGGVGINQLLDTKIKGTTNKITADIGPMGVLSAGYGYGNGLRAEIEAGYRYNSAKISGLAGSSGHADQYGVMVNGLFDFDIGNPSIYPFIGAGVGYQWAKLSGTGASGDADYAAAQVMAGANFPIASVPGLSVTAQARFLSGLQDAKFKFSGLSGKTEKVQDVSGLIGLRYAFGVAPAAPAPMAPAPMATPAPAPARTYLVFFDWDKADLTARAKSIIAEASDASKKVATTTVDVSGHADKSGTAAYNKALSLRRAQAVAAEMVRLGVPEKEIVITAFGDTKPLVPTAAGVREPQNRRVEIVLK